MVRGIIVASGRNGTLYVGVTSDLVARVSQHKQGLFEGFSKRYGCKTLVWYEPFEFIKREKQLKHWRRAWKLRLIEALNPEWRDLSDAFWDMSV